MNGRILYIFTTKSLIYSAIGGAFGLIFYYIFAKILGMTMVGIVIAVLFAALGYGVAMLKMPDSTRFGILRKTGGEKIDEVILRAIKFKAKGKRVYIQKTKEENK